MALNDFKSIYLPYCIVRQEDKSFVVLNREYKPLGFRVIEHIEYGKYPISARIPEITPELAVKISWNESPNTDKIFLYNDKTNPVSSDENMEAYLAKLAILATLKAK